MLMMTSHAKQEVQMSYLKNFIHLVEKLSAYGATLHTLIVWLFWEKD